MLRALLQFYVLYCVLLAVDYDENAMRVLAFLNV